MWQRCSGVALATAITFATALAPAAQAAPEREEAQRQSAQRGGEQRREDQRGGLQRGDQRGDSRWDHRGDSRGDQRGDMRGGRGPDHAPGQPGRRGEHGRWYDGAHGHARHYPSPGWLAPHAPRHAHSVVWAGLHYRFLDGVWYLPARHGYAVVRPPYGVVVTDLPSFRTMVTIGGLSYLYINDVYYRERRDGAYEVVPTPVDADGASPAVVDKLFVYPRQGQSPDQQAADEYDCHRWAAGQTGFDPTAAALGQPTGGAGRRDDYQRARMACLEGRGYTVR